MPRTSLMLCLIYMVIGSMNLLFAYLQLHLGFSFGSRPSGYWLESLFLMIPLGLTSFVTAIIALMKKNVVNKKLAICSLIILLVSTSLWFLLGENILLTAKT
jgi:hypothetical protein